MAGVTDLDAGSGQGIAARASEVAGLASGKAYLWGGKSTDGFDCSGFVSYVFKGLFPNQGAVFDMGVAGYRASSLFADVASSARAPGDIIIFPASGGSVNHIGIVLDDEYWIGSQSSTGVAKVKFSNPYWGQRTQEYRRASSLSTQAINLGRGAPRQTFVA